MDKQQEKQLTVFGYGLPLICAFFSWRQYVAHGWNAGAIGFAVTALIVLGLVLFVRPWLQVLFKYWMKGAHFIGAVFTAVVLTLLYFLVFTPVSLVLRLRKKDFLRLQYQKGTDSYWIKREAHQPGNYGQQY